MATKTKDGRSRKLFKFHLDIARHDDYELMEYIEDWKATRDFLPTLRKAFWLFVSLLAGSIELLTEYFPGIVEAIRQDAKADLQAENAALRAQLEQLQKQLDKPQSAGDGLEEIVRRAIADEMTKHREPVSVSVEATPRSQRERKESANLGGLKPLGAMGNSGGLKQIGGLQSIVPPVLDDTDDLELTVSKAKFEGSAAQNLINGLKSLKSYKQKGK